MPARCPISETEVSQLPRWPIASLSVSCAKAASASSVSAIAPTKVLSFIVLLPAFLSGDAFARRLAPAAKRTPVHTLGYYTFVGAYRRMRDARAGGADRGTAVLHRARRIDHQAAERRDGHIARAEPLGRAVADRPHAFPHRDVLVRDTRNAREVARLHGGAILQVIVFARAHAIEIRIDVDAPLQHVELAPCVRVDPRLVGAIPGDEVKD